MLEILRFIFSDFWIWFGSFLMLSALAAGLGQIGTKNYNDKE